MKKEVTIKGHVGTWSEIDAMVHNHRELFLMESDHYGDEVEYLIVDEENKIVLDNAWNGWGDYWESVGGKK